MSDTLIIIPAFNEEKSIGAVLAELLHLGLDADLLVVNDGSTDRTAPIVRQYPVWLVSHPVNLGYGAALQTGFKFAAARHYTYVVQCDADGQHHPEDLRELCAQLTVGDADVVIGSRFMNRPGYDPGFGKKAAIRLFRAIIFLLTGKRLTDPTSGLRGMRRDVFRHCAYRTDFPADYPDADLLIDLLLGGCALREFPVRSQQRTEGVSMHAGLRPIVYMLKIGFSITAVLLRHHIGKAGRQA